jgi:hypothetical protein
MSLEYTERFNSGHYEKHLAYPPPLAVFSQNVQSTMFQYPIIGKN